LKIKAKKKLPYFIKTKSQIIDDVHSDFDENIKSPDNLIDEKTLPKNLKLAINKVKKVGDTTQVTKFRAQRKDHEFSKAKFGTKSFMGS
jgi:hypothetical protein